MTLQTPTVLKSARCIEQRRCKSNKDARACRPCPVGRSALHNPSAEPPSPMHPTLRTRKTKHQQTTTETITEIAPSDAKHAPNLACNQCETIRNREQHMPSTKAKPTETSTKDKSHHGAGEPETSPEHVQKTVRHRSQPSAQMSSTRPAKWQKTSPT